MTDYTTTVATIQAAASADAAWETLATALLADIAEIRGAALLADAQASCDTMTANLKAEKRNLLTALRSLPAAGPRTGGHRDW